MFHDICNILVYFHQLAGEPNWHTFGYPVLIYLLKKINQCYLFSEKANGNNYQKMFCFK